MFTTILPTPGLRNMGTGRGLPPITENGVLRVIGISRYRNSPGTPAAVVPLLGALRNILGHEFWPDDVNLLDSEHCDPTRLLSVGSLTTFIFWHLPKRTAANWRRSIAVSSQMRSAAARSVYN
jgi:hypothetical protein